MKMIGFKPRHDNRIILQNAISLSDNLADDKYILAADSKVKDEILIYLQKGLSVFNLPLWLFDNNNNSIDSYRILTDGEWIWPSYFIYYLKKCENEMVSKDFLLHLQSQRFIMPELLNDSRLKVDRFLYEKVLDTGKR